MTPLERIIRPIVEGQIRGFLLEHPVIVDAVDWYKPRTDKTVTFVNSLAKRIVRDLTCATVSARLAEALGILAEPSPGSGCGGIAAPGADRDGNRPVAVRNQP